MEHLLVPRQPAACIRMRDRRCDAREPPSDRILAIRPSGVEHSNTALEFQTRQEAEENYVDPHRCVRDAFLLQTAPLQVVIALPLTSDDAWD